MDGFTGYKSATTEELPEATTAMDPFHVVRLGGEALDSCRRRVQRATKARRGLKGDPLYRSRRTLHTGTSLLTEKQAVRLDHLFADERHLPVEVTWDLYQRMIAAHRAPDRSKGRAVMAEMIDSLARDVPEGLSEVVTLGRTLNKRAVDVLAYSNVPAHRTGLPRRSTVDWSTYADWHWAFGT